MKKILRFDIEVEEIASQDGETYYEFNNNDPIISLIDNSIYKDSIKEKLCHAIMLSDMKDFIENKQIKILSIDELFKLKFQPGDRILHWGNEATFVEYSSYDPNGCIIKDSNGRIWRTPVRTIEPL
jgi:hypothetical protein